MLIDPASASLQHAMDVAEVRHGLLTQNMANLNTPGYARQDLDFEAALKGSSSDLESQVVTKGPPSLVTEAGDMAANDSFYAANARLLSLHYQTLHQALK